MTAFKRCPNCGGQIIDRTYVGDVIGKVCYCPGPDQNGIWPRPHNMQSKKCAGCGWPISDGKETRGTDNNWYHPACNPGMQVNPLTRRPVTEDDVRRIVREELKRMIDK